MVFKSGQRGLGYYADTGFGSHYAGKRAREMTGAHSAPSAKRARAAQSRADALLAEAEKAAEASGETAAAAVSMLDEKGLKRALLALERNVNENRKLRVSYAGTPEKFMESELALDGKIRALASVAATPNLYPVLHRMGTAKTLLELLTHENTDIAVDIVSLLHDLTDADVIQSDRNSTTAFFQALIDSNMVELLVANIRRLNEGLDIDTSTEEGLLAQKACESEARAVHNTLGIFESLLDVRAELAGSICGAGLDGSVEALPTEGGFLAWLLRRISVKKFDANKLYASEIMAILMHFEAPRSILVHPRLMDSSSSKNSSSVGGASSSKDGIESLLRSAHYYRKRNPLDASEEECIENIFASLCGAMSSNEARRLFRENEGVSLVLRIMKNKMYAYRGALRVLSHAAVEEPATCALVVDAGGLKSVFPAFMGLGNLKIDANLPEMEGKKNKRKRQKAAKAVGPEEEALVVSLVANLVLQLSIKKQAKGKSVDNDAETPQFEFLVQLKRVVRKFRDHNYEKTDRLVELHEYYFARVVAAEQAYLAEKAVRRPHASLDDVNEESLLDMAREDAGLETLQGVALIISSLCSLSPALRKYILEKLDEQEDSNAAMQVVSVLEEMAEGSDEQSYGSRRASSLFQAMKVCVDSHGV